MSRPIRLAHLFHPELIAMFREHGEAVARQLHNRGWRSAWITVSAVPDVAYPYDPAVVRAIREFDPNVIPLFVRRGYKAPTGEMRVKGFHAFASVRWNPSTRPAPWTRRVLMPTWTNAPQPTHMDMHLEDRTTRRGDGLPGSFLPFDWRWYHALRSAYQEWSLKDQIAFREANDRAAKARKARIQAEERVAERHRKDAPWLKERISRIDRHDVERVARKIHEPERTVMVGPF